MLCELNIQNLALIETLRLTFENQAAGLIVMTGETGAGKSIMLRAIHLLTGARASADWIRSGAETCTVEALFEIRPEHAAARKLLEESGFGDDTAIVIKRVFQGNGRSRIYVNGSLATSKMVAELTGNLLNIAGQHDQQQLLQPALHLDFLDGIGELDADRNALAVVFEEWRHRKEELMDLQRQEQDKERRKEFLRFQLGEIGDANLSPGEDEALAAERLRLKNADLLLKLSYESYTVLAAALNDGLTTVRKNMEQAAALDHNAAGLAESLAGYAFQAEDLVRELRAYRDALESDPVRLEQVGERIDHIRQLKRKYGETIESILGFAEDAERELADLEHLEIRKEGLEKEVAELEGRLMRMAASLSERRRLAAGRFEQAMAEELGSLAFHNASFQVHWQEVAQDMSQLRPQGWDRVEFYFSANPGEPPRPLSKVASGGELSRLMLALKCLLAKRDMVETVIFDEVDAGIGGQAAEAVARKIQELAGHHQVFCITHLPQIAARGTVHFLVAKQVREGRTQSSFSLLNNEERVAELARMLAGESVTTKTHAWATELLEKGAGGI